MKNRIFSLGVMALMFAACSVNEMDIASPTAKEAEEFFATIEDASTRVFVDDDLMVLWHADDRVSIFNKYTYNQQYRFTGNTGANSGSFTKVPNDDFVTGNALNSVYAIYPYKESTEISNQGVLTIDLPATQSYAENSFGIGANTMVSCSEGNELLFKNLCGYIMLKLYGNDVSVKSISIKGNNDEPLAGKATVNASLENAPTMTFDASATKEITLSFDAPVTLGSTAETATTFWLVIPPTTFSKGITLTVKDDKNGEFTKSTTASLQVSRNTLKRMSVLEAIPEPSDEPIVFADIIAKYACVEKFDTNGDGEVSYKEAAAATSLSGLFTNWKDVKLFDEIKYFTSVTSTIDVFSDLSKLERITIPNNITTLGSFQNCTSLKSVVLPATIDAISSMCFDGCSSLVEVNWPQGFTKIPACCFRNCISLDHLELPSLTRVFEYAFQNCTNLSISVVLAEDGRIYSYAFSGCENLTSVILGKGSSVSSYAFHNCKNLTSATLPSDMTVIPEGLFYNCENLREITLPDVLSSIGASAFYGCSFKDSDYTLELPATITSIGKKAFYSKLRHLIIPASSAVSITNDSFDIRQYTLLYVPENMVDMYRLRTNWSIFSNRIRPINEYPSIPSVSGLQGDAIDLGLSVKWASWNVGASSPEQIGDYFAWGEIQPKWVYDWDTYIWCNGSEETLTKYNDDSSLGVVDNKVILEQDDDAVHIHWGGNWRMPTSTEWTELKENCSLERTTENGVEGMTITSKINGHSIFLPCSGYWASTLLSAYPSQYADYALCNYNGGGSPIINPYNGEYRSRGLPIRPVTD